MSEVFDAEEVRSYLQGLPEIGAAQVRVMDEQLLVAVPSTGMRSAVQLRNAVWNRVGTQRRAPMLVVAVLERAEDLTPDMVLSTPLENRSVYRAPDTDTERAVCELIADVVEQPQIGVDDDLFDLDADSLTLIEISTSIYERFGVPVQMQELFEAGTAGAISQLLEVRREK